MTKGEVIEKLQAGYDLANRGTGWWLSPPRKAYASSKADQVTDEVMKELEASGQVKVELLTRSLRAYLVETI